MELRECFALIDEDGSGAIDVDEMRTAFSFLGVAMSQREVEDMFAQVDEDKSGEIEFNEFIEVCILYHRRWEGEWTCGGLHSTGGMETPLPSNSPHDHMILRVELVGSHARWKRPCLQTAHMTI